MIRLLIPFLLIFAVACQNADSDTDRKAVARAGDRVLYLDQIPTGLVVSGMSQSDSISAVQSYIRQWSRKELLALRAEENLTPEYKAEVNRQLNEMRNNLLIYQYQQQLIIQKMDTTVSDSELQDYYVSNLSTFTLTTNLVKALYIKVPSGMSETDRIRKLYRSQEAADMQELEAICTQNGLLYDDFNDEWINFTQLLLEVPLESDNQEQWLERNSSVELRDDRYSYFLAIREYRLRNSVAPFEYIRSQVRTIILNNRRNDFLQKLEDGIYNEAISNNTLKLY
jgi:ribosomal protein S24E